jgi:hypothetical protein
MNDTVTTTIPHYPDPSKELLSPLTLQNRISAVKDSLGWFYPLERTPEPSFEVCRPSLRHVLLASSSDTPWLFSSLELASVSYRKISSCQQLSSPSICASA